MPKFNIRAPLATAVKFLALLSTDVGIENPKKPKRRPLENQKFFAVTAAHILPKSHSSHTAPS